MSKTIQVSPELYKLLNEFTDNLNKSAEIVEKIKAQASKDGLSMQDTRELIISFAKRKKIEVKQETRWVDHKQKPIDVYIIDLPTKESKPLPEPRLPPQPTPGTPSSLAESKGVISVIFDPCEYSGILAQAIRDDRKLILRIKDSRVIAVDQAIISSND